MKLNEIGLYILSILSRKYQKRDTGLYRDDGLAIFKSMSGPKMERIKKDIIASFKKLNLKTSPMSSRAI